MTEHHLPSFALLRIIYICALGSLGTQNTFLPLALNDSGLSYTQVSLLLTLLPIVRVAAPPLWGYLADRYQMTSSLLRITFWGAFLCYLPILNGGWLTAAIFLSLYCFFYTPVRVLTDAIAFQKVAHDGGSYGEIRSWGVFAYIVVTLISGTVAGLVGVRSVVIAGSALLFVGALFASRLPAAPPRVPQKLRPAFRQLAAQPGFTLFIIATALHAVGQTCYDSFFPIHLRSLGFSEGLVGVSVALGATGEALAMRWSHRFIGRFGAMPIFIFATALAAVRWYLNATVHSVTLLIAIQVLHAVTFGLWWVSAATHLDREAPREIKASAQAILILTSFGIGGGCATLLSAWIGGQWGTSSLFIACSALSGVAAVCSLASLRKRQGAIAA